MTKISVRACHGVALSLLVASLAMISAPGALGAGLSDAIRGGKVTLDMRYRYEFVAQDNALKNAGASTVGTRLGYMTGAYYGVKAFLELSNVTAFFGDDYNSGRNGKTQYAVVADPEITVANRAFVSYAGPVGTALTFGRQRIIFDNARFIGNVGWRQTEQTYDGLRLDNTFVAHTDLSYVHMTNANTVTGTNRPMHADLIHAGYSGLSAGTLSAYAYLLDFRDSSSVSSQTFGARFAGAHPVTGAWSVVYAAEYARQSDYGDNPARFALNYWRAELGPRVLGVTLKAGYERLGSNGTVSVQTPLATLHAMNGWADQFLVTPAKGLDDRYASLGTTVQRFKLLAVYHDFRTAKGGARLGREWDLRLIRPIGRLYTLLVKFADFHAGDAGGKVNTVKAWVMGRIKF